MWIILLWHTKIFDDDDKQETGLVPRKIEENRQFGFRKQSSTIYAISKITKKFLMDSGEKGKQQQSSLILRKCMKKLTERHLNN